MSERVFSCLHNSLRMKELHILMEKNLIFFKIKLAFYKKMLYIFPCQHAMSETLEHQKARHAMRGGVS